MSILDEAIRNDLNQSAPRRMAVLEPLKVILTNYDGGFETLNIPKHPQNPDFGRRDITFSKEIYIDQEYFQEVKTPGFKRLSLNGRARLMNAYVIECHKIIRDIDGNIEALECIYLPETLGGKKPEDGVKVKGIIQWLDANNCLNAEVRIYDRLFNVENPSRYDNIADTLNPESLKVITNAKVEPSLANVKPESTFQFNRIGYFCADRLDHHKGKTVFNRTATLRDGWKK
jgi:glutaminyl-tRNA synthetase